MKNKLFILLFLLLSTSLMANADFGMRFFKKNLSTVCSIDGASFAQQHTQDEWDEIKENKKLLQEWISICPKGKEVFLQMKHRDVKNLFDFVWAYASDSGEVPTCSE